MAPSAVSQVLDRYGPDVCPSAGARPLAALPGIPASSSEDAALPNQGEVLRRAAAWDEEERIYYERLHTALPPPPKEKQQRLAWDPGATASAQPPTGRASSSGAQQHTAHRAGVRPDHTSSQADSPTPAKERRLTPCPPAHGGDSLPPTPRGDEPERQQGRVPDTPIHCSFCPLATDSPCIQGCDYVVIGGDALPRARWFSTADSTEPLSTQPLDGAVFGPVLRVLAREQDGRTQFVQIGSEWLEVWGHR
jgi:hypothetical protein